jgi:glycosyltransferase involved in cell wall biosynthesis
LQGTVDEGFDKGSLTHAVEAAEPPLGELFPEADPVGALHRSYQAWTLAALASSRGIGHLHAHFGTDATTVALLASRLSAIPFSFTAHARDIYHTYVDPLTDDILRKRKIAEASFVVTVSDYNRRHLAKLAGPVDGRKVQRVYNGVDLTRFRPSEAARESALFLTVGRLIEKKGITHLVEACRLMAARGRRFRCLVVGQGPDEGALRAQIAEAGLTSCVELLGALAQQRVRELIGQASAMVLPCVVSDSGDRDGLPTVLLEALAGGLPAISTTVAGVPEIIEHETSGLLVPPADPSALANAMERLLDQPDLRARLALAARRKAEKSFDLRANVAHLRRRFIDSVAGGFDTLQDTRLENRLRIG